MGWVAFRVGGKHNACRFTFSVEDLKIVIDTQCGLHHLVSQLIKQIKGAVWEHGLATVPLTFASAMGVFSPFINRPDVSICGSYRPLNGDTLRKQLVDFSRPYVLALRERSQDNEEAKLQKTKRRLRIWLTNTQQPADDDAVRGWMDAEKMPGSNKRSRNFSDTETENNSLKVGEELSNGDQEDEQFQIEIVAEQTQTLCPLSRGLLEHPVISVTCKHVFSTQSVELYLPSSDSSRPCPVVGCSSVLSQSMLRPYVPPKPTLPSTSQPTSQILVIQSDSE